MTTLATQQTEAAVLNDFFDRTEQLRQIADDAKLKYSDALARLHGDSSEEARALSLVIVNSGGGFLEAMEQAYKAGCEVVGLLDAAAECGSLSDVELSEDLARFFDCDDDDPYFD